MLKTNIRKTKKKQKNKKKTFKNIKKYKKYLIGGTNDDVIFACTTLNKGSTLSNNFEIINNTIRKYIPKNTIRPVFIFKQPPLGGKTEFINDEYTVQLLKTNDYNMSVNTNTNTNIEDNFIDYIENTKDSSIKMIVFSQCSELITSLINETYKLGDGDVTPYEYIRYKVFLLYTKLNSDSDSYLINFYYGNTNNAELKNIEYFYSFLTLTHYLPLFLYCILLIKILFTNIEEGVYKKINGITKQNYETQSNLEEAKIKMELQKMFNKHERDDSITPGVFQTYLFSIYKNLYDIKFDTNFIKFMPKTINIIKIKQLLLM